MNTTPYNQYFAVRTTPTELAILLPMIQRLTKPDDKIEISIRELEQLTSLSKSTISRNLCSMAKRNLLGKEQRCPNCTKLSFCKDKRCFSCNVHLDCRHLVYTVLDWPKSAASVETYEETHIRLLHDIAASLASIKAEVREHHDVLNHLTDEVVNLKDTLKYEVRDLSHTIATVGEAERYAATCTDYQENNFSAPEQAQDNEIRLSEAEIEELAAQYEEYLDSLDPVPPAKHVELLIWDSTAGPGAPLATAAVDLTDLLEAASETGTAEIVTEKGVEVLVYGVTKRTVQCITACHPREHDCMYVGSFFRSFFGNRVLSLHTSYVGAPPLRSDAPGFSTATSRTEPARPDNDERRGKMTQPTPLLRAAPLPTAKISSVLDHWLGTVTDYNSDRQMFLRAARNLSEHLASQQVVFDAFKKDAEAGFFEGQRPRAPNAVWNRAMFCADLIRRLYPGANVSMKLLIQQIGKRGFERYVDEQVSFYKEGLAMTYEMIPHVFGQKVDVRYM